MVSRSTQPSKLEQTTPVNIRYILVHPTNTRSSTRTSISLSFSSGSDVVGLRSQTYLDTSDVKPSVGNSFEAAAAFKEWNPDVHLLLRAGRLAKSAESWGRPRRSAKPLGSPPTEEDSTSAMIAVALGLPAVKPSARGKEKTPGVFPCVDCGKVFKWKANLYQHRKLECGKEPQFQCPHCHHRSKRRADLVRHISTRHYKPLKERI